MKKHLTPPFFEFGPKAYLYGEDMLAYARHADALAVEFGVDIVVSPQLCDIRLIASACKNIKVFAQHMDGIPVGRGMGMALPEALREAGARGALLNHSERRMTLAELEAALRRAKEVEFITLVCADSPEQAAAIAHLSPDALIVESPMLIGGGGRGDDDAEAIRATNRLVAAVDPTIKILHAAGIANAGDVHRVIAAGSDATGSTSGIVKAADPFAMMRDMIAAVRRAWDERHAAAAPE